MKFGSSNSDGRNFEKFEISDGYLLDSALHVSI